MLNQLTCQVSYTKTPRGEDLGFPQLLRGAPTMRGSPHGESFVGKLERQWQQGGSSQGEVQRTALLEVGLRGDVIPTEVQPMR